MSDGERSKFLLKLSLALESTTRVSHHHPLLKNLLVQEPREDTWSTSEGAAPEEKPSSIAALGLPPVGADFWGWW